MRFCRLVAVAVASLLIVATASAQSGQVVIRRIDASNFPLVSAEIKVMDSMGRSQSGLQRDSLVLKERGVEVPVANLEEIAEAPLGASVAIVFDAASSLEQYHSSGRAAVQGLMGSMSNEEVALFLASDAPESPLQYTSASKFTFVDMQRNTIINHLSTAMQPISGTTQLYQALAETVDIVSARAREVGSAGVVVVISDGRGSDSGDEQVVAVRRQAERSNVALVVLALGTRESLAAADTGYRLLQLTSMPGSIYIRASELEPGQAGAAAAIKTLYDEVFRQTAVSSYRLTYESQLPRDGALHSFELSLRGQGTAVTAAEGSLQTPLATVRLRSIQRALTEYFLFALVAAVVLAIIVAQLITQTRRPRTASEAADRKDDEHRLDNTGTRR